MAICTFSNTVSRGKMFVRWNERARPSRQIVCGGCPVMSRPLKPTRPESGARCPVMTLNSVVLPAPLGPITAEISPGSTEQRHPAQRLEAAEGP